MLDMWHMNSASASGHMNRLAATAYLRAQAASPVRQRPIKVGYAKVKLLRFLTQQLATPLESHIISDCVVVRPGPEK